MPDRIYFDHSATTPVDPRVAFSMKLVNLETFGNPSSLHFEGRQARELVERARGQVAELLRASSREIVFTASGTEADNLALLGVFCRGSDKTPGHMITSAIEHPAIIETCRSLEQNGIQVTYLGVDEYGLVDPDDLGRAFRPNTRLVSIMAANNVVGTLQPIGELARMTKERGALFHTDAVQYAGKLALDVTQVPLDMVSMSAHKLHGPKGIGALYVRRGLQLQPLVFGGGQEHGLRSATENVAGIVGFGKAAQLAATNMADDAARLAQLRYRILEGLQEALPQAYLIGHPSKRLPGHLCLGFSGQEGESIRLLLSLDQAGVAISSGSACSAHKASEPSYVLLAMGFDPIRARGTLRVTLGRFNTAVEVDRFLEILPQAVNALRPVASYAGFVHR
ncbi:MAG: cysteine desulfurase family protein [Terriglobales bacterium]|jgi:cysteine desulfurase